MTRSLSISQARRLALSAQGFADPRPAGRVDVRHLRRVVDRVSYLQIDSVSAVVRSHYFPAFSRLGAYRRDLVDDLAHRRRELLEQWCHVASFVPMAHWPLMAWRTARREMDPQVSQLMADHPGILDRVLDEVAEHGPIVAGDSGHHTGSTSSWWGWSPAKLALEWLFASGQVGVAARPGFARAYDLIERIVPADLRAQPVPDAAEAVRDFTRIAARSLGVATIADLADYPRLPQAEVRTAVAELVDAGELVEVEVEGWDRRAYLDPNVRLPRGVQGATLLSPFDSLVWFRPRDERLWDFHYRIEIYTPKAKRRFGYYVLPLLVDERVVGRLDVRRDGAASLLRVPAAWHEAGVDPGAIAEPAARAVADLAAWLGCERVEVADRGDLAPALRQAIGSPSVVPATAG